MKDYTYVDWFYVIGFGASLVLLYIAMVTS